MTNGNTNNSGKSKPQALSPAGRDGEGLEPSSGYTTNIDSEISLASSSMDSMGSTFSNMQECYVSKSGPTRMLTATRYGKRYMLKCLKADYAYTPVYRQALQKEFEIGLQLEHPNICRTLSMEHIEGLGSTIVMEYVDGSTLQSLISRRMLSVELAMKITRQLLDALEYMHGKQIIHRDLKPANIMVTHRGNDVKVIDFSLSDSDAFCVLKSPAGTMGYIAPEQLVPGAKADARADIYSLGKVLQDMADTTRSRTLSRLAAECACTDISARPSTVAQVRALLSVERMPWRILSWLLTAAAVVLLAFICATLYRHSAAGTATVSTATAGATTTSSEQAPADTTLAGGGNKVLDRSCWP